MDVEDDDEEEVSDEEQPSRRSHGARGECRGSRRGRGCAFTFRSKMSNKEAVCYVICPTSKRVTCNFVFFMQSDQRDEEDEEAPVDRYPHETLARSSSVHFLNASNRARLVEPVAIVSQSQCVRNGVLAA